MILVLLATVLMAVGIGQWQKWKRERARSVLAGQFRASLQNLVFALRGGVSLPQAIEYAAQEGEEPMAAHWKHFCQSLQLGKTLSEALESFIEGLGIREAHWFGAAVLITKSTGGSLAEVLDSLSESLREQQSLRDRIQALTAQGKASGILLSCLPFVILGAVMVMAPELASPLFTTWSGQGLVALITVMVAAGGWVIQKIVTVPMP